MCMAQDARGLNYKFEYVQYIRIILNLVDHVRAIGKTNFFPAIS